MKRYWFRLVLLLVLQVSGVSRAGDQRLLLLTRGFHMRGQNMVVAVGDDISALEADIRRYQLWSGLALLALLVSLLVVQQRLASRIFEHLEQVRSEVHSVARGELAQLDESVPNEVLPLVQEVNRLLQLLARRMERSRHALGNLAHAMKAPLN